MALTLVVAAALHRARPLLLPLRPSLRRLRRVRPLVGRMLVKVVRRRWMVVVVLVGWWHVVMGAPVVRGYVVARWHCSLRVAGRAKVVDVVHLSIGLRKNKKSMLFKMLQKLLVNDHSSIV